MPIFEYNLVVWSADFRQSCDKDINAVFAIYLKRWLGLPYATRSSLVHFLTETAPLTHTLLEKANNQLKEIGKINLSVNLNFQELLLVNDRTRTVLEKYNAIERIPTGFWSSEALTGNLPMNFYYRKKLCNRLVDSEHWKICLSDEFHTHSSEKCKCMFCKKPAEWFHVCL